MYLTSGFELFKKHFQDTFNVDIDELGEIISLYSRYILEDYIHRNGNRENTSRSVTTAFQRFESGRLDDTRINIPRADARGSCLLCPELQLNWHINPRTKREISAAGVRQGRNKKKSERSVLFFTTNKNKCDVLAYVTDCTAPSDRGDNNETINLHCSPRYSRNRLLHDSNYQCLEEGLLDSINKQMCVIALSSFSCGHTANCMHFLKARRLNLKEPYDENARVKLRATPGKKEIYPSTLSSKGEGNRIFITDLFVKIPLYLNTKIVIIETSTIFERSCILMYVQRRRTCPKYTESVSASQSSSLEFQDEARWSVGSLVRWFVGSLVRWLVDRLGVPRSLLERKRRRAIKSRLGAMSPRRSRRRFRNRKKTDEALNVSMFIVASILSQRVRGAFSVTGVRCWSVYHVRVYGATRKRKEERMKEKQKQKPADKAIYYVHMHALHHFTSCTREDVCSLSTAHNNGEVEKLELSPSCHRIEASHRAQDMPVAIEAENDEKERKRKRSIIRLGMVIPKEEDLFASVTCSSSCPGDLGDRPLFLGSKFSPRRNAQPSRSFFAWPFGASVSYHSQGLLELTRNLTENHPAYCLDLIAGCRGKGLTHTNMLEQKEKEEEEEEEDRQEEEREETKSRYRRVGILETLCNDFEGAMRRRRRCNGFLVALQ
ncbi:hypothetical protein V1478_017896, partial [Vespula squamosa]